tara:strand:+ start:371 stop:1099 length:729 start_codon:yes stop_codon:yes gene_type:complete
MESEKSDDLDHQTAHASTRDTFSDALRERILSGEFPPGNLLPSERALAEESKLSRGSVREAIRSLEVEGLVEISRGRFGGSRVVVPKRDRLVHLVDIFVRANDISLSSMLDCRAAIEPMLARLAARNMTDEALAKLERLQIEFRCSTEELKTYRRLNYEWHLQIANLSNNQPLMTLIEPILSIAANSHEYERVTTLENRLRAIAAHEEIMFAFRAGDEIGAAQAMETHLISYSRITRDVEHP